MYVMLYRPGSSSHRGWLGAWLEHAAPLVINVLIGDSIIINLGIDGCRPDNLIRRYVFAPRAKTQAKMNRLYVTSADIWLAFRLQLFAKVFLLTLMFSSAMPFLLLLVAFYCWSAQFVDRYLLFRVLKQPPRTQVARLMYVMICWLLPLAVVVRLGVQPRH